MTKKILTKPRGEEVAKSQKDTCRNGKPHTFRNRSDIGMTLCQVCGRVGS